MEGARPVATGNRQEEDQYRIVGGRIQMWKVVTTFPGMMGGGPVSGGSGGGGIKLPCNGRRTIQEVWGGEIIQRKVLQRREN